MVRDKVFELSSWHHQCLTLFNACIFSSMQYSCPWYATNQWRVNIQRL